VLGHSKPETTARYSRVAIGLIAKIESPLEGLHTPRRRRAKPDNKEPPAP
jgi:integrase/recombinase XerD